MNEYQQRPLQVSASQYRMLQRFPRHQGVWRSLGVRLGSNTRVVVGANRVRLGRSGARR